MVERIDHPIHSTVDEKRILLCGRVIKKGPGFLVPNNQMTFNDIDSLIAGTDSVKPMFVPMDVEEGDFIYYHKDGGEDIFLDGRHYVVVQYTSVRLFVRKEG